jgi:hypothetical protein
MRSFLLGPLLAFAGRLRFKWLFLITAALFLLTLVFPDPVPFADEILLGLATLVLAQWKRRDEIRDEPAKKNKNAAASKNDDSIERPVIDLPNDQVRREP